MHDSHDVQIFPKKINGNINELEIEIFAERLIRKGILVQHVDPGHPTLQTEERLIKDSTLCIFDNINDLSRKNRNLDVLETFLEKINNTIFNLLDQHDLEDGFIETVMNSATMEAEKIIFSREKKYHPKDLSISC